MNVILILLDSLNKSFIGPYGNQRVETKNMDKLAERGVVFENHFLCSAPLISFQIFYRSYKTYLFI
ncbi:MAG: sulfatase-like hydrolase/transferase [Candidatus Hodarchaeota archaeon]